MSSPIDAALAGPGSPRIRAGRPATRWTWLVLALVAPAAFLTVVIQVYPTLYSFYLSFGEVKAGKVALVGLDNYAWVFSSPKFWQSTQVTIVYGAAFVLLTFAIAMALALAFNSRIRGKGFYLTVIFVPWILSEITSGVIWRWMFLRDYGVLQNLLGPLFGDVTILATPVGAITVLVASNVWKSVAFALLLLLTALQTISTEIDEAARLDGAGLFRRLASITLPLIRPTATVVIAFMAIQAVNSIGMVMSVTEGGPGSSTEILSLFMYRQAMDFGKFGVGSAVAVVMFFVNLVFALTYLRALSKQSALGGR
ncbi:MAG: sugar ABC transporter permease [Microbacteriaceae bacterium]|nr:sugar ABC transporter permease [Microbacteriaceae bacterium]